MTTDEVVKFVEQEVRRALSEGQKMINLREVGEDPRQDARFLMRLYEAFPDETPESGYQTIIVLGRRWRVALVEGYIRLEPIAATVPQGKKSLKEYREWWAQGLAIRGIAMKVPDGQLRPIKGYTAAPSEEADESDE